MREKGKRLGVAALTAGAVLWVSGGAFAAQSYSSGSTGALGAFTPSANTTVPLPSDGVLHYTTVTIPTGVTVTFQRNAANTPVTLLATGDVTINGTLSVKGADGVSGSLGGPGGFAGGVGGGPPVDGVGPGGGPAATVPGNNATYGVPASFVSLVPLFGGSGGGSGRQGTFGSAGGGGGGGAIVLVSSTRIHLTGTVTADGGNGESGAGGTSFAAGGGSGGAVRLVAPRITGAGTVQALGGLSGTGTTRAGNGRIRLESFAMEFSGTTSAPASFSAAPGPVTLVGNPGLVNLPTLKITAFGSQSAPATPGGSYTAPDVTLPGGTTNPVTVTLDASHIPFPATFTVRVTPRSSASSTVTASAVPGGTFEAATYTADVTLPSGQTSIVQAFGSFTLPQLASLFPDLDGEPADHILVAVAQDGGSRVSLVTDAGTLVPVESLSDQERVRLALAIQHAGTHGP